MVIKVKENFGKTRHVKNKKNLKNISFEDKEIHDIMKKYYRIKINLIISFLFLIQHNFLISGLSSVQKSI